jgi:hypothetical protein
MMTNRDAQGASQVSAAILAVSSSASLNRLRPSKVKAKASARRNRPGLDKRQSVLMWRDRHHCSVLRMMIRRGR